MNKAPDAFRTISEVADDLDLPQHVLRFWESRFPQIRPMKRGGGRRYYRPEDIDLLRGIRHLLYGEGYTIRGVQRILREQGLRTVQSVGQGRAVALPAPSGEDAAEGEAETEAGQGILKFLPRRLPDAAADHLRASRGSQGRCTTLTDRMRSLPPLPNTTCLESGSRPEDPAPDFREKGRCRWAPANTRRPEFLTQSSSLRAASFSTRNRVK